MNTNITATEADRINQIRNTLRGFSGTEGYHRLGLSRAVVATDGVAYLCKECQCYWLFDVIASHQLNRKVAQESFQVWRLELTPNDEEGTQAVVTCQDDEPGNRLVTQKIPMTDFPLKEGIKLWLEEGSIDGVNTIKVLMLPGER